MHHRPLALVSVLAGGDYLLWNWSLQGNHDVWALVSGLTLTPLAIALLWLLALNGARLLGWIAQRPATTRGGVRKDPHRTASDAGYGSGGNISIASTDVGGEQTSPPSKLAA